MTPLDCCFIVIHDRYGFIIICEFVILVQVMEDVAYVLKAFCTFVNGINFGFSGASCGDGLAFTDPMQQGATKPYEEARDGS